jgi:hypothetical protein
MGSGLRFNLYCHLYCGCTVVAILIFELRFLICEHVEGGRVFC